MPKTALIYVLAAVAEIAGCFGFWLWLRQNRAGWIALVAMASLALFAWLLTRTDSDAAGRAFAAYGGVYVAASLVWLWLIEGIRPDRWDLIGGAVCVLGASIILFAPRTA